MIHFKQKYKDGFITASCAKCKGQNYAGDIICKKTTGTVKLACTRKKKTIEQLLSLD